MKRYEKRDGELSRLSVFWGGELCPFRVQFLEELEKEVLTNAARQVLLFVLFVLVYVFYVFCCFDVYCIAKIGYFDNSKISLIIITIVQILQLKEGRSAATDKIKALTCDSDQLEAW